MLVLRPEKQEEGEDVNFDKLPHVLLSGGVTKNVKKKVF